MATVKKGEKKAEATATASAALTAYCMKTKEKNVPIQDAVVNKTANGRYIALGHDGKGNKITTILNEEKAIRFTGDGTAKKGTGWK